MTKKQQRAQEIRDKIKIFFQDFGVYIATLIGIVFSPSILVMMHGKKPTPPDWGMFFQWEFYVILVIALVVDFVLDFKGETKGKRKNWKKRLGIALWNGVFWITIFGK